MTQIMAEGRFLSEEFSVLKSLDKQKNDKIDVKRLLLSARFV